MKDQIAGLEDGRGRPKSFSCIAFSIPVAIWSIIFQVLRFRVLLFCSLSFPGPANLASLMSDSTIPLTTVPGVILLLLLSYRPLSFRADMKVLCTEKALRINLRDVSFMPYRSLQFVRLFEGVTGEGA